jgi:hypothetical protein
VITDFDRIKLRKIEGVKLTKGAQNHPTVSESFDNNEPILLIHLKRKEYKEVVGRSNIVHVIKFNNRFEVRFLSDEHLHFSDKFEEDLYDIGFGTYVGGSSDDETWFIFDHAVNDKKLEELLEVTRSYGLAEVITDYSKEDNFERYLTDTVEGYFRGSRMCILGKFATKLEDTPEGTGMLNQMNSFSRE